VQNLENENLSLKTNIDEIKSISLEQMKSIDENKMDITEIKLKINNIENEVKEVIGRPVDLTNSEKNNLDFKKLSFASVLRNGSASLIADKIVEETKVRGTKEKNIIITGLTFDNLTDSKPPVDVVNDLLLSIDASASIIDFIRFKKDNNFINKVMVTLSSKSSRDNVVSKSKSVLRGKNIFVNKDLTQLEMQAEYDLRQEKRMLISALEVDDKEKLSFYIKDKTIWVYDKVTKVQFIVYPNTFASC
jgi:hypothetical protein